MNRPAEMSDYNAIVSDHPRKLSPAETGYVIARQNNTGYHCDDCLHFYKGNAARNQVCEVVRRPNSLQIESHAACKFWTRTGTRFPLYDRLSSKEQDK